MQLPACSFGGGALSTDLHSITYTSAPPSIRFRIRDRVSVMNRVKVWITERVIIWAAVIVGQGGGLG